MFLFQFILNIHPTYAEILENTTTKYNPEEAILSKKVVRIEYSIDKLLVTDNQILNNLIDQTQIEVKSQYSRYAIKRAVNSFYSLQQYSQVNVYGLDTPEGIVLRFELENVTHIQKIDITGVRSDDLRKAIRDSIKLVPGDMYLPIIASNDVNSIKAVCSEFGYFNADVRVRLETSNNSLTYQIHLSNPIIVSDFEIEGNSSIFGGYINEVCGELVGVAYNKSTLIEKIEVIDKYYKAKFYPNSEIVDTFNPETGILTLKITEGIQLILEFVDDSGKPIFHDSIIRNVLTLFDFNMGVPEKDVLRTRLVPFLSVDSLWTSTIQSYFEEKGYEDTTVVWKKLTNVPLHIKFTITLGTRYLVDDISFEGNLAFTEKALLREMNTKSYNIFSRLIHRRIFTQQTLGVDLERLRILYQKAGYPNVNIRISQLDKRVSRNSGIGKVSIHLIISEDRKEVINRCMFLGNGMLDTATLLESLPSIPPQPNAPLVLKSYQNAILKVYQDRGYMDVAITNQQHTQYISELEKPTFRVEGDYSDILDSRIIPKIVRDRFKEHKLSLDGVDIATKIGDKWSIQDIDGNARYTLKHEDSSLSVYEHGVLQFHIYEGSKIAFGDILFAGDSGVKQHILDREVSHLPGTLFTPNRLSKVIQNLYGTGIFEPGIRHKRKKEPILEEQTNDIGENNIPNFNSSQLTFQDVLISLQKREAGAYGASIGYSSSEGPRGTISFSYLNLLQRNIRFRLRGRGGIRGYLYDSTLTEPWILGRTSGSLRFLGRKLEEDEGVRALQGSFSLSRKLYQTHRLNLEYSFRGLTDTSEDPLNTNPSTTVSSLRFLWRQDNSIPSINPIEGMVNELTVEYAGGFLGGKSNFIKTIADSEYYRTLNKWGIVLATALRFGITTDLQEDQETELISFERFWAGGSTTIRGYEERGLGPVDSTGKHRGNIQFIFNTELRFPIFTPIDGVLFFDSGNVWNAIQDIEYEFPPTSIGAGMRLIIGPIIVGLDYAVPIISVPDVPIKSFYFRVGNTF